MGNISVQPKHTLAHGATWAIFVTGYFADLRVWVTVGDESEPLVDTYECCPNPYHFRLEADADCTDDEGFHDDLRVSHIDCDDIEMDTDYDPKENSFIGFRMDLVDKRVLKTQLQGQMDNIINGRAAKTVDGKVVLRPSLPFKVTSML